jgi:aldose 1-epimerase
MPEAATFPGDLLLRAGKACAVLRPAAGGRVCSLTLARDGGRTVDVLFPYSAQGVDPLRWAKGGIYPLLPYSNRIANAQLQTPDGVVDLSPHPDAAPHTLHGPAHGMAWTVQAHDEHSATLTLDHPASAAWPWHFRGEMRFHLSTDALQMDVTLTNLDARSMPAGLGWHPYFLHQPSARLRYRASQLWTSDKDFLAQSAGPLPAHESFEVAHALRDGTMTDYLSGWDGQLELDLPEGEVLQLHTGPLLSHLVVHRPPQGGYLCIEPVSHVANGFNLAARGVAGTGSVLLASGESLSGPMTLRLQARTA